MATLDVADIGPVQIADIRQVFLGPALFKPKPGLLLEAVRDGLARKLRAVRLVRRLSSEGLAQAAGLSLTAVMAAESGTGVVYLDDVEKMAQVLKVGVGELFREPGGTVEERVVLAMLGEGG